MIAPRSQLPPLTQAHAAIQPTCLAGNLTLTPKIYLEPLSTCPALYAGLRYFTRGMTAVLTELLTALPVLNTPAMLSFHTSKPEALHPLGKELRFAQAGGQRQGEVDMAG